jgi:undecaprenyl-diphosphatase
MVDTLGDARVRLATGVGALVATGLLVHRDRVAPLEARAFRAVNDLPDCLFRPAWVVMQLGNVGAAPAVAAVTYLRGERGLARRALVGGVASWALSKVVKRGIRRPRPQALLPRARRRGAEAAVLGYLSGHAAVVVALATAAAPHLDCGGRVAAATLATAVGLCRLYVGAHLPLDVLGGVALGLAVEATLELRHGGREPEAAAPKGPNGGRRVT